MQQSAGLPKYHPSPPPTHMADRDKGLIATNNYQKGPQPPRPPPCACTTIFPVKCSAAGVGKCLLGLLDNAHFPLPLSGPGPIDIFSIQIPYQQYYCAPSFPIPVLRNTQIAMYIHIAQTASSRPFELYSAETRNPAPLFFRI